MKAMLKNDRIFCKAPRAWLRAGGWLLFGFLLALSTVGTAQERASETLSLNTVLKSVTEYYPPYLSVLVERDIARGTVRHALGAMDLQTYLKLFQSPAGFYESTTAEAGFEQFTNLRGVTIYGNYRYTEGFLPDYYRSRRTNGGGTPTIGLRVPLLRDGAIDPRRAAIYRANIDQELADPYIQNQHLNLSLGAMRTYFHWLAAGRKLAITESLLNVAKERNEAIQTQITQGLMAPIAALENQQLVVSRELSTTKARRQLQAATAALSLFYRDGDSNPVLPSERQLPPAFPTPEPLPQETLSPALQYAASERPEVRLFELKLEQLDIDTRLFKNQLQPYLNAYVSAGQSLGDQLYKDTNEFEVEFGFEFKMPLQRRAAKGKLQVNQAKIDQLQLDAQLAMDQIATDVWDAHSAVRAAWEQIEQARTNVSLATQLHDVERDRFALGAVDFLTLQLREQSAFQARLTEIDVLRDYYVAVASLMVATGIDCRRLIEEADAHPIEIIHNLNPRSFSMRSP